MDTATLQTPLPWPASINAQDFYPLSFDRNGPPQQYKAFPSLTLDLFVCWLMTMLKNPRHARPSGKTSRWGVPEIWTLQICIDVS